MESKFFFLLVNSRRKCLGVVSLEMSSGWWRWDCLTFIGFCFFTFHAWAMEKWPCWPLGAPPFLALNILTCLALLCSHTVLHSPGNEMVSIIFKQCSRNRKFPGYRCSIFKTEGSIEKKRVHPEWSIESTCQVFAYASIWGGVDNKHCLIFNGCGWDPWWCNILSCTLYFPQCLHLGP